MPIPIHLVFDLLAALVSMLVTAWVYRWRIAGSAVDPSGRLDVNYMLWLAGGAIVGAFAIGTLALQLETGEGIGRSVIGALAGGIAAVESYKATHGIRQSTGLVFVPAFAVSVAIGRIGCFLAGLPDRTHGVPTGSDWGWDFGDGILRHPVQLYESAALLAFLAVAMIAMARRNSFFMRNGFYVLVAVYSLQRFAWEFLKPGAALIGPLNIFHLICMLLIAYSAFMLSSRRA